MVMRTDVFEEGPAPGGRQVLDPSRRVAGEGPSLPPLADVVQKQPGSGLARGTRKCVVPVLTELFFRKSNNSGVCCFSFDLTAFLRPAHPPCPSVNREA